MRYCILFILLYFLFSCNKKTEQTQITGNAQGTTYSIIYIDSESINYQSDIDSIFKVIDKSMSLWDTTSIISRINAGDTLVEVDTHFAIVFRKSQEISEKTNGAFDITVGALVRGWGFGLSKAESMDSAMVDSLRSLVNYKDVNLENGKIITGKNNMMIDFNAIAQGYTVDVIADFFDDKKIKDYLIEIGGELRAKGKKSDGSNWRVGIDKPIENTNEQNRELQVIVELKNSSLATSGNYRKFYEKDGRKYSHTIDPSTGYPVAHNLLSVSVIADDCMTADAYATAFMVMGTDEVKKFVAVNKNIETFLIFDENGAINTWASPGFEKIISK